MAADVYSVPPHTGRGGWTWYKRFRRVDVSSDGGDVSSGLNLVVDELQFTPRIPQDWKSFKLDYRYRETVYHITCLNSSGTWQLPPTIVLDGNRQSQSMLKLVDDRREHFVEVKFES